ncbi:MAG: phage tail sheath family protein [Bacteroidetes bacterium]|nr:phage tail sheath family protein [Bacteroidota bacterium]
MRFQLLTLTLILSLIISFSSGQNPPGKNTQTSIKLKNQTSRPGVYTTQINTQNLIPVIRSVETSIPVFIGYSQKAIYRNSSAFNQIIEIGSFAEYEQIFGESTQQFYLWESVKLFYENGGGKCFIISVGSTNSSLQRSSLEKGLQISRKANAQLVLVPDAVGLPANDFYQIQNSMLSVCAKMKDRFAILNTLKPGSNVQNDIQDFRAHTSGNDLGYGAVYYPWLITNSNQTIPPSGAVAGIIAQNDRNKGVWKAPANISLRGIQGLTNALNSAQRDMLNVSPGDGKSINSIVTFSGKGIVVWGARTLAGNDNEWRYISARRLGIMIENSIQQGIQWVSSKPNDANLWTQIETQISNYLTGLWRDGALVGTKPEHAFFVKCGLNKTMTAQDISQGKLIIQIGLSMVRPAEFTVMSIEKRVN